MGLGEALGAQSLAANCMVQMLCIHKKPISFSLGLPWTSPSNTLSLDHQAEDLESCFGMVSRLPDRNEGKPCVPATHQIVPADGTAYTLEGPWQTPYIENHVTSSGCLLSLPSSILIIGFGLLRVFVWTNSSRTNPPLHLGG
jgi:hypothetical protein